ncbi:MAG: hypothetical protein APF80_14735 [Alphaproteobacteria bacterium BRH_c36]|nr:MAG: hypothetical protein APF80_14735 [Alphaproteobacteria bacterium BRH_c36]
MGCDRSDKTVQIGGNAFTISGERTAEGSLRFTVHDMDCALPDRDDEIALRFRDALKRRIQKSRRERGAADAIFNRREN